jgi:hypothetical protein
LLVHRLRERGEVDPRAEVEIGIRGKSDGTRSRTVHAIERVGLETSMVAVVGGITLADNLPTRVNSDRDQRYRK